MFERRQIQVTCHRQIHHLELEQLTSDFSNEICSCVLRNVAVSQVAKQRGVVTPGNQELESAPVAGSC